MKVSIIMPSKNVVNYIEECLNSVVNQTLKEIEIICVDAFSTDGTREIIQRFAENDNRIILLDDDMGSCGYSYNKGIAIARGEYIGFVETDDYVKTDMFEILYQKAIENNLDYVKANHIPFINVTENERFYIEEKIFASRAMTALYGKVFDASVYPEILWPDHCMWNGIYKSTFLKEKNVRLNESKGPSYQDHGFQWQTMVQAKRVMYLDTGLYYYRKDNETASMKNPKGMIRDFSEFMFIKDFLQSNDQVTKEHWWIYYQKLLHTFIFWTRGIVDENGHLPEEVLDTLGKYKLEFENALSYEPSFIKRIGYKEYEKLALICNDSDAFLRSLAFSNNTFKSFYGKLNVFLHNKEIVVFGAGDFGERCFITLVKRIGTDVLCFCDNDKSKQGTKKLGKSVISVEDAVKSYKDAAFIIANDIYYLDCLRQLEILGIPRANIEFYISDNREY